PEDRIEYPSRRRRRHHGITHPLDMHLRPGETCPGPPYPHLNRCFLAHHTSPPSCRPNAPAPRTSHDHQVRLCARVEAALLVVCALIEDMQAGKALFDQSVRPELWHFPTPHGDDERLEATHHPSRIARRRACL